MISTSSKHPIPFVVLLITTLATVAASAALTWLGIEWQLWAFLLLAAGLAAGVIVVLYPNIAFYSLLLLTPADTLISRLFIVAGITDKATLIKDGLVFLMLLALIYRLFTTKTRIKIEHQDIVLAIFAIFLALQAAISPYLPAGVFSLRGLLWFGVIYVYVRTSLIPTVARRMMTICVMMALITAVYGFAQLVIGETLYTALGYGAGEVAFRTTGGFIRVISTSDSAATWAAYTMIWSSVFIGWAIYHPKNRRLVLLVLAAMLLGNMFFTTVRAAWLGVVAGMCAGWFINRRFLYWMLPIVTILAITMLVVNITMQGYLVERVLSIVGRGDDQSAISNLGHLTSLDRGLNYFWDSPWTGIGLGTTGIPGAKYAEFLPHGAIGLDNFYLKMMVETGIVGLGVYLLVYGVLLLKSYWAYRLATHPTNKGLALGIFMALVGLAVISVLHSILESPLVNILFWLLTAVSLHISRFPHTSILGD